VPEAGDKDLPVASAAKVAEVAEKVVPVGSDFKAYVDVPTMEDIEKLIIKKKKETLMAKYASVE